MMMLHWKSIFNFITMKLTFTSLFYTCFIFGLVSRLFLFSFIFLSFLFFFVRCVATFSSSIFFVSRSRCGICRSFYWSKKIYMHYVMRVTLSNYEFQFGSWFILSHFCFLNWFFFKIRFLFAIGVGTHICSRSSSRNKVISRKCSSQKRLRLFILFVLVTKAISVRDNQGWIT